MIKVLNHLALVFVLEQCYRRCWDGSAVSIRYIFLVKASHTSCSTPWATEPGCDLPGILCCPRGTDHWPHAIKHLANKT